MPTCVTHRGTTDDRARDRAAASAAAPRPPQRGRRWLGRALCLALAGAPLAGAAQAQSFWDQMKKDAEKAWGEVFSDGMREGTDKVREGVGLEPKYGKKESDQGPSGTSAADLPRYDKPWVIEVQARLTGLGYQPGPADGVYGAGTKMAMEAFQRDRGLPVTGLPTPSAMQALRSAGSGQQAQLQQQQKQSAAHPVLDAWRKKQAPGGAAQSSGGAGPAPGASPAAGTPSGTPTELTFEAQDRLNQMGYDAGPVDGQYGSRTAEAIKDFQRDHGLAADGRVTPTLLSALRLAKPGQPIAGKTGGEPGAGAPGAAPPHDATPADFAQTPAPDYVSLLRLYAAANPDLLQNDAFAWHHHLVFEISTGDPTEAHKRCMEFGKRAGNEITRLSLLEQTRKSLQAALPSLAQGPKTAVFLLRAERTLRNYDLEKKAFPLGDDHHVSTIDGRTPLGVSIGSYGKKGTETEGRPSLCRVGYYGSGSFGKQLDGEQFVRRSFALKVEGGDKITHLPMPIAEAERHLNQHGRKVVVEALVEVGPIVYGADADAAPARILMARVLEPEESRVLHEYPASLFAPQAEAKAPGAEPGPAEAAAPISMFSLGLVAVGGQPGLADDDEALAAFAARQVRAEQQLWQQIDTFRETLEKQPQRVDHHRLNPGHPIHTFEWQALSERQPELARGPLLDLFVEPRPDWSFLEREPWWDSRFRVVREAFLFSRDSIVGRDPEFAARELLPVFRRHLLAAAEKAPKRLVFTRDLPRMEYDFDAKALRPPEQERKPFELLPRVSRPVYEAPAHSTSTVDVLPAGVRSTIPYAVFNLLGGGSNPPRDEDRVAITAQSAPERWRYGFHALPRVGVVALDRSLVLSQIPLDAATAEEIAKARGGGTGVDARVTLEVVRTEVGERISRGERKKLPVVFARLLGVEIIGPGGKRILTLGPEAFESAQALATAKADSEKAKAEAEADAAARQKATEDARAKKLAALMPPGDGSVLVTLAATRRIEEVYTTGGSAGVAYRQTVESRGLDLPIPGKGLTVSRIDEVLRGEPGAAVVLPRRTFEQAFPSIEELELKVTAFPPEEPSPLEPGLEKELEALLPGEAHTLMVRRTGDGEIERVFAVGGVAGRYAVGRMDAARQGIDLPRKPELIGVRQLPEVLKAETGIAVVIPREHFRNAYANLDDLELEVTAFPPTSAATARKPARTGASPAPSTTTTGDERPASDFRILEITIGMSEADALAAVGKEFAAEQITRDPARSAVFAEKGRCEYRDPAEPAVVEEAGSICLALQFADGAVSRIALRQVIAGDVTGPALEAFKGRYGEPVYRNEGQPSAAVRHTVVGWGKPVGMTRSELGRVAHMAPPMVLEGNLWLASGATIAVLRLDPAREPRTTAAGSGGAAPKIKF